MLNALISRVRSINISWAPCPFHVIFSAGELGCLLDGSKLQEYFLRSGSSWSSKALTQKLVQCHFCHILCSYHRWSRDSEGRKIVLTSQREEDQRVCGLLTIRFEGKKISRLMDTHYTTPRGQVPYPCKKDTVKRDRGKCSMQNEQ